MALASSRHSACASSSVVPSPIERAHYTQVSKIDQRRRQRGTNTEEESLERDIDVAHGLAAIGLLAVVLKLLQSFFVLVDNGELEGDGVEHLFGGGRVGGGRLDFVPAALALGPDNGHVDLVETNRVVFA